MPPTPEQEPAAIRALFCCVLLAAFGAASAVVLIAWLMAEIAKWVFGWSV